VREMMNVDEFKKKEQKMEEELDGSPN